MQKIKKYGNVAIGIFLVAISYNLFFSPCDLDTGGISGLAIVIKKLFFINESIFIFIMNFLLLILSYIILGKELTKNTILGSILLPFFINFTENINQFIVIANLDPLLITLLGGVISGIGYGMLFKNNFTSGGTDILNQIAEKKFKIPMNLSMIYIDGLIVLLGGFIFGVESFLYSVIALLLISNISNKTIIGMNQNKVFYIQTEQYKKVIAYLTKELHYDVTIFEMQGGFSEKKKKLILCSVKTNDYYKVKTALNYIDHQIFITITENYELLNANLMVPKKEKRRAYI